MSLLKEILMNIFLENVTTADEAVEKLAVRGILTSDGMVNCCVIAADIEEILCNENLQKELLYPEDVEALKNIPVSKKEQVLQEIRAVGITSWNLGRGYLPRWDFTKRDFEEALEKRFS